MKICAVVVTFHPDKAKLATLLETLRDEADHVVIVDNTPANRGIAAAQNRGIALAKAAGATHVLFLDQDSLPRPGMTRALVRRLRGLEAQGVRVACVGPRLVCDGVTSRYVPERAYLISSGSLVPRAVLEGVGGMEEALFIDQVDTEWCLRARARGYRVFCAPDALLEHRLGEGVLRLWLGRRRRLFRHAPARYYTIFRNTLLVCRRDYAHARFVLFQAGWLAALFVAFGLLGARDGALPMMLRGLAHGAAGRRA